MTESASHLWESIRDVNIWHQTGGTIVGIEHEGNLLLSPSPYAILEPGDHIFFVGEYLAYSRLKNLFYIPVRFKGVRKGGPSSLIHILRRGRKG
ncbi:cation:proton antiporter regulatory subunit, partial [Streptococcus pluranimalium]